MKEFKFSPATFIPFRDPKTVERVRKIKRKDIARHRNPDFQIQVLPDADIEFLWIADMFHRIQQAAEEQRKMVLITPNPWPSYAKVAYLINKNTNNKKQTLPQPQSPTPGAPAPA